MSSSNEFAKLMNRKLDEVSNNRYNEWDLAFDTDKNMIDAIYMPGKQLVGSLYRVTITFDDKDINNVQVEFPNRDLCHPYIEPKTKKFCIPKDGITAQTELKDILQAIHSAFMKPNNSQKCKNKDAKNEYIKNSVEFWRKIRNQGKLDEI